MAQAAVALILGLCLAFPAIAAQGKAEPRKPPRSAWSELSPSQQKILAPLQKEWAEMDATRRKKWVAIANRYPKMKPQEQRRLQTRMANWAKLTPAQRKTARRKYQSLRQLPPEKRREVAAQWRRYQRSLAAQPGLSPSDPPAPPEATETAEVPPSADTARAGAPTPPAQ